MTFSPIILSLLGYFVFSSAVGAMAEPSETQQRGFYGWMYRFLQRLAANADRLAAARFGGVAVTRSVVAMGTSTVEGRLDVASELPAGR